MNVLKNNKYFRTYRKSIKYFYIGSTRFRLGKYLRTY